MSHIRVDRTHEPEPASHSHFQKPRVWRQSHQDAAAFPLSEPIDREFGPQSSLSVIIPARNEASSYPALCRKSSSPCVPSVRYPASQHQDDS